MNDAPDFRVDPADWSTDRDALRHVRDVVFIQEQNVPIEEEWDDLDPQCRHVLARDAQGEPIGTARLTPQHKIGRMAVLAPWRHRGVGAAMLVHLLDRARDMGWTEVTLHAQVDAIDFYTRHGFEAYGEEFVEAGIRHRMMRRSLDPLQPAPAQRGTEPQRPDATPLACNDLSSLREATLAVLTGARHAVWILSPDLDPGVLDTDAAVTALRRLATRGRGGDIRLLVHDAAGLLAGSHRLVELAQRMPSVCRIRVVEDAEDRAVSHALVMNDAGGVLLRPQADQPVGRGATCDPLEHARLHPQFQRIWDRARPAHELRPLDI